MYGKIVDGKLVVAGKKIQIENGWITNPTEEDLRKLGYKEIEYNDKPSYDIENQKLKETYTENENKIIVNYEIIELTDEEKLEVKQQKVIMLEQQYNMCRYQRELILADNSGASQYTKDKAQEVENIAKDLRTKLRTEE